MPKVKDQIKWLRNHYQSDEHIAIAIWCEVDIMDAAARRHIPVSRQEAQDILDAIDDKQDCSIGINWDVLDAFIDEHKANI